MVYATLEVGFEPTLPGGNWFSRFASFYLIIFE